MSARPLLPNLEPPPGHLDACTICVAHLAVDRSLLDTRYLYTSFRLRIRDVRSALAPLSPTTASPAESERARETVVYIVGKKEK